MSETLHGTVYFYIRIYIITYVFPYANNRLGANGAIPPITQLVVLDGGEQEGPGHDTATPE